MSIKSSILNVVYKDFLLIHIFVLLLISSKELYSVMRKR